MTEIPQEPPKKTRLLTRLIAGAVLVVFLGCYIGLIILSGVRESVAATFTWQNPIYFQGNTGKDEVRDPCIIKEGDTWYLVFTVWPFRNREETHLADADQGSSPGIKLFASKDLKTWTFEKWLVKSSDLPENCPYKHRFWAPEIHKMGGKFYLIFTADNWLKKEYNPAGTWGAAGYAFVGVADKVTGPYEHITYIAGGACDTSLFEDSDGRTYALIPRGGVDVQEIDLAGIRQDVVKLVGKPVRVVAPENADIGMEARPEYLEGPWAIKSGDKYVLFFAGPYSEKKFPEQKGYWAGAAYADNVMGPYKKEPRGQLFLGGHLAVFTGPNGRNWFSYRGEKDRETRGFLCIDPFDIDAQGRVQTTGPSVTEMSVPVPAAESKP
ncbi:MAG: family 43 glycosylhydrolase [Planctomycetota bacterium]|nr:family 43 glycosylhydrolase [Planctomycetota bacterium]